MNSGGVQTSSYLASVLLVLDEMETKSPEGLGKLKVAELKKLLKEKGLPTSGTKAELLKRLQEADAEEDLNDIDDEVLNVPDERDEQDKENLDDEVATLTDTKTVTPSAVTEVTASEKSRSPILSSTTKLISKPVTTEDKLSKRAERFGAISEDLKKSSRAARFGLPVESDTSKAASGADVDKMKKRSERFGAITSQTLSKAEEKVKLAMRAERFGNSVSTAKAGTDSEKLLKRAQRFGGVTGDADDIEAKKQKRAERFKTKD